MNYTYYLIFYCLCHQCCCVSGVAQKTLEVAQKSANVALKGASSLSKNTLVNPYAPNHYQKLLDNKKLSVSDDKYVTSGRDFTKKTHIPKAISTIDREKLLSNARDYLVKYEKEYPEDFKHLSFISKVSQIPIDKLLINVLTSHEAGHGTIAYLLKKQHDLFDYIIAITKNNKDPQYRPKEYEIGNREEVNQLIWGGLLGEQKFNNIPILKKNNFNLTLHHPRYKDDVTFISYVTDKFIRRELLNLENINGSVAQNFILTTLTNNIVYKDYIKGYNLLNNNNETFETIMQEISNNDFYLDKENLLKIIKEKPSLKRKIKGEHLKQHLQGRSIKREKLYVREKFLIPDNVLLYDLSIEPIIEKVNNRHLNADIDTFIKKAKNKIKSLQNPKLSLEERNTLYIEIEKNINDTMLEWSKKYNLSFHLTETLFEVKFKASFTILSEIQTLESLKNYVTKNEKLLNYFEIVLHTGFFNFINPISAPELAPFKKELIKAYSDFDLDKLVKKIDELIENKNKQKE